MTHLKIATSPTSEPAEESKFCLGPGHRIRDEKLSNRAEFQVIAEVFAELRGISLEKQMGRSSYLLSLGSMLWLIGS